MSADPIEPDTKDWTWTTVRACPECGFDASTIPPAGVLEQIQTLTVPWERILAAPGVRHRPAPHTWSPLEYGCHVSEVLEVFAGRFTLVQTQDTPTLPNWDQDAAAVRGEYAAQDPALVAQQIAGRGRALLAVLASFAGADWERRTRRSDGAEFTALSLARYLVHDLAHHLHDVGADHD